MKVIAVDAMGADNAPGPEIEGALAAVRDGDLRVVLVGDEDQLTARLGEQARDRDVDRITIHHAPDRVTMSDDAARVYRSKPQSSMRIAFDLVRAGDADAVVSAGHSGALMAHGLFGLGRLPGIERPGIVSVLPNQRGGTLVLCDSGANVEVKPAMLAQFGLLGVHYDRLAHDHARPRLGLLSNGAESSKGTALTRAADELLRRMAEHPEASFDYAGYVEGSDLFTGAIDAVATDGFTGNVVLKLAEGFAEALFESARRLLPTAGEAAFAELRQTVDYRERGGALLGGVAGVVMICHGRSDGVAIKNAIRAASAEADGGFIENLAAAVARFRPVWDGIRTEEMTP